MANTERSQWMGEYMRRHAVSGPGAFKANQRVFRQGSVAYADSHGGVPARRNPRSNAAVRSNPTGGDLLKLFVVGFGAYMLVPPVKKAVDHVLGGPWAAASAQPAGSNL